VGDKMEFVRTYVLGLGALEYVITWTKLVTAWDFGSKTS
jgi:hypothetical protein